MEQPVEERPPIPLYGSGIAGNLRPAFAEHQPDLLDVRGLVLTLLKGSWFIILFGAIGVWLGVRHLSAYTPTYEAALIVSPTEPQSGGGGAGARSEVGQRLGINIEPIQASATTFDRLKLTFGSLVLAHQLNDKYDILHRIYGGEWNEATQQWSWSPPQGGRAELEASIRSRLHLGTWTAPTIESVAANLKSSVRVEQMGTTQFYRITYRHTDPQFALWLLGVVYREADELLRTQDRASAIERKRYLESQVTTTPSIEGKAMLNGMLSTEVRRLMLLDSSAPYAAQIVEPLYVSNQPSTPDLVRDFGVGVVGWALAGAFLVVLYSLIRTPQRR